MTDVKEIMAVIEAALFVAGEPVALQDLQRALDVEPDLLNQALIQLEGSLDHARRGLRLKRFGEHVQLCTRPEYAPYIELLLQPIRKQSLSQSALETLAVVAYRQPVTKMEIEQVRGVKCDYSVQSLIKKGLIEDVGRKDVVGRPILYGTTDKFLSHFGLSSLDDLPLPAQLEAVQDAQKISLIP